MSKREAGTPETDAAQERCLKAVEIFMTMPLRDRERQLNDLVGDVVREIICTSKDLERGRNEMRVALDGLLNALPSATTHPAIKAARAALQKGGE